MSGVKTYFDFLRAVEDYSNTVAKQIRSNDLGVYSNIKPVDCLGCDPRGSALPPFPTYNPAAVTLQIAIGIAMIGVGGVILIISVRDSNEKPQFPKPL